MTGIAAMDDEIFAPHEELELDLLLEALFRHYH